MKDKHVTDILERAALTELSEAELEAVRSHTTACAVCRSAYEAARASELLLRARAAETIEPTPFFQTRVLAALRERQAQSETNVFKRMWKATGALVTSMAATVAALAVLTFLVPGMQTTTTSPEMASSSYSADEIILNKTELPEEQMSYEQILVTLYGPDEEAVK